MSLDSYHFVLQLAIVMDYLFILRKVLFKESKVLILHSGIFYILCCNFIEIIHRYSLMRAIVKYCDRFTMNFKVFHLQKIN